ncbi:hypothetical protein ABZP36_027016 [Zizania latifolia]
MAGEGWVVGKTADWRSWRSRGGTGRPAARVRACGVRSCGTAAVRRCGPRPAAVRAGQGEAGGSQAPSRPGGEPANRGRGQEEAGRPGPGETHLAAGGWRRTTGGATATGRVAESRVAAPRRAARRWSALGCVCVSASCLHDLVCGGLGHWASRDPVLDMGQPLVFGPSWLASLQPNCHP